MNKNFSSGKEQSNENNKHSNKDNKKNQKHRFFEGFLKPFLIIDFIYLLMVGIISLFFLFPDLEINGITYNKLMINDSLLSLIIGAIISSLTFSLTNYIIINRKPNSVDFNKIKNCLSFFSKSVASVISLVYITTIGTIQLKDSESINLIEIINKFILNSPFFIFTFILFSIIYFSVITAVKYNEKTSND